MPFIYDFPRPAVTVDAVIFKKEDDRLWILLIQRGRYPYEGMWALPGGFVEMDETLGESVAREVEEETGLKDLPLEQLHTFGDPGRDPRGRTVSVVYWGIAGENTRVRAGDDARSARWFEANKLPALAFDHSGIIQKALERLAEGGLASSVHFNEVP